VDFNILFLVVGVIVAVAGIVGTNIWSNKQRTDRLQERKQVQNMEVEKLARDKIKEEQILARELAAKSAALALDVKQDMKDHIDRLIVILKQDIELSRVQAYAKLDTIESKVAQVKIDLMDHIEHEKDERIRMQRSIDFFQTMQFGPEAKSIPPYLTGEERTPEHEDEPYKGVFASRADTTDKDTKDPVLEQDPITKETKTEQDKDAETESDEK